MFSKIGYGKTKREVLQMVEAAAKKGVVIKGHISDGWLYHFCQRWPKVRGDPFSQAGAEMTNRKVFTDYFELLKATLLKHDLLDKPSQIYNCDESGGQNAQNSSSKGNEESSTAIIRKQSSNFHSCLWKCHRASHTTHGNLLWKAL